MLIGVLLGYLVPDIPAALSSLQVGAEVGNRIDFEEGGPGKIIGYMMSRFKPQAAHTVAGTRNVFMVANLDEAQMTEMMLIASKKLDTYPEFTPVFPGSQRPKWLRRR